MSLAYATGNGAFAGAGGVGVRMNLDKGVDVNGVFVGVSGVKVGAIVACAVIV